MSQASTVPPPEPSSHSEEAVAARRQSNLAFALRSLEPHRRHAMEVFYDFCRRVDDIADDRARDDAWKAAELECWRRGVHACYDGTDAGPLAELAPYVGEFAIAREHLLAIIDGVAMDIGQRRFQTIEDLKEYCYGVASAVGLVSIRIFGCEHPDTPAYAENLGYALQLTNILRDVAEDYQEMGRVYLPLEELAAFGVQEADLAQPADNPRCRQLLRMCHYRCQHYFAKARRLLPPTEQERLKAALVMASFYQALLEKIRRLDFRITAKRVRLSKPHKVRLLWQTLRGRKTLSDLSKPSRVAVWGGGVAGITAAVELGRQGHTPVLLESRPHLGGRAHSFTEAQTGLTLDNGQHVLMGCYHAFLKLLDTLGTRERLDERSRLSVPYRSEAGASKLSAVDLPGPLHLLGGMMAFSELRCRDRVAIVQFGLQLRLGQHPLPGETAACWLKRWGQTPGSIRALWEPFCLAALNEPSATADAALLEETLRRSLFGKPGDSAIFIAREGFSALFEPETAHFLRAIGGELHRSFRIREVQADEHHCVSALTSHKGQTVEAPAHICALPWHALAPLLPEGHPLARQCTSLEGRSILGAHFLLDTCLFEDGPGFVGLIDSSVHWVFDRTATLPPEHPPGQYLYSIIVSAAEDWLELPTSEVQQRIEAELRRLLPAAHEATVLHASIFKWRDATFTAQPAAAGLRPQPQDAPWPNVILAGDWTATRLPATLEGAADSAYRAVETFESLPQSAPLKR